MTNKDHLLLSRPFNGFAYSFNERVFAWDLDTFARDAKEKFGFTDFTSLKAMWTRDYHRSVTLNNVDGTSALAISNPKTPVSWNQMRYLSTQSSRIAKIGEVFLSSAFAERILRFSTVTRRLVEWKSTKTISETILVPRRREHFTSFNPLAESTQMQYCLRERKIILAPAELCPIDPNFDWVEGEEARTQLREAFNDAFVAYASESIEEGIWVALSTFSDMLRVLRRAKYQEILFERTKKCTGSTNPESCRKDAEAESQRLLRLNHPEFDMEIPNTCIMYVQQRTEQHSWPLGSSCIGDSYSQVSYYDTVHPRFDRNGPKRNNNKNNNNNNWIEARPSGEFPNSRDHHSGSDDSNAVPYEDPNSYDLDGRLIEEDSDTFDHDDDGRSSYYGDEFHTDYTAAEDEYRSDYEEDDLTTQFIQISNNPPSNNGGSDGGGNSLKRPIRVVRRRPRDSRSKKSHVGVSLVGVWDGAKIVSFREHPLEGRLARNLPFLDPVWIAEGSADVEQLAQMAISPVYTYDDPEELFTVHGSRPLHELLDNIVSIPYPRVSEVSGFFVIMLGFMVIMLPHVWRLSISRRLLLFNVRVKFNGGLIVLLLIPFASFGVWLAAKWSLMNPKVTHWYIVVPIILAFTFPLYFMADIAEKQRSSRAVGQMVVRHEY